MKTRITISVILLAFCLGLCFFAYNTEKAILNKLSETLEDITQSEYLLPESAEKLNDFWIENKDTLSAVLKHADIDSLDIYINEIVYEIENNEDTYSADIDETVHFIDEMLRNEKISTANIF